MLAHKQDFSFPLLFFFCLSLLLELFVIMHYLCEINKAIILKGKKAREKGREEGREGGWEEGFRYRNVTQMVDGTHSYKYC